METRANYVLIGAVTLLGVVAAFGFFLWYARIAIDRQYDYYTIRFDQVSGLSRAGDVRFNGILVGQVLEIDLSRTGAQVRVDIEVRDGTPIDSGTIATLRSQGVTGVSYVALASGPAGSPPIAPEPDTGLRVIRSEPSVIDSLIEGAPALLKEATDLLRDLSGIVSPENRDRVTQILDNVEIASGGLEKALSDFSAISGTVREGVDQISAFTGRLDGIATQAETTLKTADTTLTAATAALVESKGTLEAATGAFDVAKTTISSVDTLITGRGPGLVDGYEAAARSITATVEELGAQAEGLVARLGETAEAASARLQEAQAPIAAAGATLERADAALAAVTTAADGFDALISGDGAALVAEARAAVSSANRLIETDAPMILADVRTAAATVNRVVAEVGADVTEFSGRLDGLTTQTRTTLADASETFRAATATLGAIDPAVTTAARALSAAEAAFTSADRVLSTDIEPIVADARATIARLDAALAQVSADLPAITAEMRTALAAATGAAQRVEAMVARSAPPVETFAQSGLPQFGLLAQDARALVDVLDRLVQTIQRDPARFFLGGQVPEYRR